MIRKATLNDLPFIYELYMHPQINPWLLYEPMSLETFKPIFIELLEKNIKYVYEQDGNAIGMCKLAPFTYRTSHSIYLGGVGIHPSFAGKGQGIKRLQEIISFCHYSGYLRIELSVAVDNGRAIHLYQKAGFEKEGVLRKYTFLKKVNRYVDEMIMSYLM